MTAKDLVRFQKKMRVSPMGCWQWTACRDPAGYGRFSCGGMGEYAHRAAYEHWVGRIPKGLHIDHLCRNRDCVNPVHMEVVTPRVNILRGTGAPARNARKARCCHGHEFTGGNTMHYPLKKSGGYGRKCRKCYRLVNQRYYYKTKEKRNAITSVLATGST